MLYIICAVALIFTNLRNEKFSLHQTLEHAVVNLITHGRKRIKNLFITQNEFFAGYKQAHRRDDDIAIVNAGMKITLDKSSLIQNAAFASGGMAPFTVMALKTMKGVIGRLGTHFRTRNI